MKSNFTSQISTSPYKFITFTSIQQTISLNPIKFTIIHTSFKQKHTQIQNKQEKPPQTNRLNGFLPTAAGIETVESTLPIECIEFFLSKPFPDSLPGVVFADDPDPRLFHLNDPTPCVSGNETRLFDVTSGDAPTPPLPFAIVEAVGVINRGPENVVGQLTKLSTSLNGDPWAPVGLDLGKSLLGGVSDVSLILDGTAADLVDLGVAEAELSKLRLPESDINGVVARGGVD